MKIAIMSDTHDHIANLRSAFTEIRKHGAEAIIHCGDFVSPFMVEELASLGLPVYGVFGNNDGDRVKLVKNASECGVPFIFHSDVARFELDGDYQIDDGQVEEIKASEFYKIAEDYNEKIKTGE